MEIKKVPAKNVFTITEFPQLSDMTKPDQKPIDNVHIFIDFTCPHCEQKLEFKENDFQKHINNKESNLSESDAVSMKEAQKEYSNNPSYSLDFYCPKCNSPVCVFYNAGVAGRGELFYKLEYVAIGIN